MAEAREDYTSEIGSLAGLSAGILTGAQVGTALIPIPGVGTFAGAFLGGLLGSEVGRVVGGALINGVNAVTDTLRPHPEQPTATPGDDEKLIPSTQTIEGSGTLLQDNQPQLDRENN